MKHKRNSLFWMDANRKQVRSILMRNAVSGTLWTVALGLFLSPEWGDGPSLYLFDTLTGQAARVTVQGPDEWDVKISSDPSTLEARLIEMWGTEFASKITIKE